MQNGRMRIAVLNDIHGNLRALEAVLSDVERWAPDRIVVGGDVAYGPFPRETLAQVLALGSRAVFVRGNTDRAMLESQSRPADDSGLWAARDRWCAARLTPELRTAIETWPLTATLEVDGLGPVLFVHATARSDEEIFTRDTPDARVLEIFAGVTPRLVVCGHTHVQFDRTPGDLRLVNAGSVGMAYQGKPGIACWAALGPDVDLRQTIYDHHRAAVEIRASGFPEAEEFIRRYVLEPPTPDAATEFFENVARSRA